MKKMRISVGIPVYNEEQNIIALLNAIAKQRLISAVIEKVFVINGGSTDSTKEKVECFIKSGKLKGRLEFISRKNREGKWLAINTFFKRAKSEVLILESADNLPAKNCFELLAKHFYNKKTGIVASRIVPLNDKKTFFGFAAHLIYGIHHDVSLESPKFGELIAFRNVMSRLPETIDDEEEIASIIQTRGYSSLYEPKAIVYNKGPENLSDFISQRKRVYFGHIEIRKRRNYSPSTMNSFSMLWRALKKLTPRNFFKIISICLLEGFSRLLGYLDYMLDTKKQVKWKPIKSVKNLRN
jgi:biofilm PGA synthesis N-glycosyltransferase PgaC